MIGDYIISSKPDWCLPPWKDDVPLPKGMGMIVCSQDTHEFDYLTLVSLSNPTNRKNNVHLQVQRPLSETTKNSWNTTEIR